MDITIKIDGRLVTVEVSTEVADYLEQAKHNGIKLNREQRRHWDGRELDEYIIAAEGRLPYCATPEDIILPAGNAGRDYGGVGPLHRETAGAVSAPCPV